MTELYPYCSRCEKELQDEEREMNRKAENIFYPICEECLVNSERGLKRIVKEIKEAEEE